MEILKISGITKHYGDRVVLNDFTLDLTNGIYGLLGPNGAGKTTLINIIATALKADGGNIFLDDMNIFENLEEYRSRLGFLPQYMDFYKNFTGMEFLLYFAELKKITREQAVAAAEFVRLEKEINRRIGTYSGGMKRRLGIAQAIMGKPRVLLLDEPTVGLDIEERTFFKKKLSELAGETIVILSTHIASDVEQLADHIIFMKGGEIVEKAVGHEIANLEEYYTKLQ